MTTHEYDNPTTQSERRQVLKDTLLSRAQSEADMVLGGRFSKINPTRVTGVPQYPAQPASSPWHHDPVPATEPLGFSVDQMEPVGEHHEVQASLDTAAPAAAVSSGGPPSSPPVVKLGSNGPKGGPPFTLKRRGF